MTNRERFLSALTFRPIDRIPLVEWNIRGSTMREWVKQGYPEGVPPAIFFDLDPYNVGVPIHLGMHPEFEERIMEDTGVYKIWRDKQGAVRKDFSKDMNPGFVTRTWLSFPVQSRDDFLKMKERYDSKDPERIPQNFKERAKILNLGVTTTHLSVPFLFWTARDWIGFENLCMMFYDDPSLVHEIFAFLTDFCIDVLRDRIRQVDIDVVELKEDMAYKHAPMISPHMFRTFMFPHYRRFIEFLKGNGVKLVYVDCDGYPGGLIPEFLEAGVDAISPVEIAAGNDVIQLREEYPRLGMLGGIDKRELAKDRKAIYQEVISKVPVMLEKGGYIPHVDHGIPHDVPLVNHLYSRELLTNLALGKSVREP